MELSRLQLMPNAVQRLDSRRPGMHPRVPATKSATSGWCCTDSLMTEAASTTRSRACAYVSRVPRAISSARPFASSTKDPAVSFSRPAASAALSSMSLRSVATPWVLVKLTYEIPLWANRGARSRDASRFITTTWLCRTEGAASRTIRRIVGLALRPWQACSPAERSAARGFSGRLIHGLSLLSIALAVVLLITPAALHHIVWSGEENETVLRTGSRITILALQPLALGMAGDAHPKG